MHPPGQLLTGVVKAIVSLVFWVLYVMLAHVVSAVTLHTL
jgi:hypothetical protein